MDEELLELMYSESKIADSGVSKEEYSKFLMEDEELRNSAYSEMGFKSQGISTEDFNNMLGLGKKKDQTELVQEDTESVSEVGSSESQETVDQLDVTTDQSWRGDQKRYFSPRSFEVTEEGVEKVKSDEEWMSVEDFYQKPFEEVQALIDKKMSDPNLDKTDSDKLANQLMEVVPPEILDAYIQNVVSDRASEEVSKEFNKTVLEAKKTLPINVDYSANTIEEVIDELPDELVDNLDSDVLTQAVTQKREEAFDNLANQTIYDKFNSYLKKYEAKYDKDMAKVLAKEDLATEMIGKELKLLGLSDEDLKNYKSYITELDKLRRNPVDPKDPNYKDYALKIRDLDSKITPIRELSYKRFMNPETGVISEEEVKKVNQAVTDVRKEYGNDYTKLKSALDTEVAKLDYLESRNSEIQGLSNKTHLRIYYELGSNPFSGVSAEDMATQGIFFDSDKEDKVLSLLNEYKKSLEKAKVLSRALLLNEDVTATSRGFELLKDDSGLIEGAVSLSESLYEGLLDKDYLSENDYATIVNEVANKEGVDLRMLQSERAKPTTAQTIGSGLGSSVAIGSGIALNRNILKSAAGFISLPSRLAKLKYVEKALEEGTKLNKAFKYVSELAIEDLAFQLESDELGSGMGASEKVAEDLVEKLASKVAGTKVGRFTKFLDSYVTRVARKTSARTVGGTVGEYAGDFVNQGIKDGFFTEQQFKDVFGEGEEAVDKLIITASIAAGAGLPSTVVSSFKSKYKTDSDNGKLLQAYEESERIKEKLSKGDITQSDLEVLKSDDKTNKTTEDGVQEGEQPTTETEQEAGDLQVDETSQEETTTSKVLEEKKADIEKRKEREGGEYKQISVEDIDLEASNLEGIPSDAKVIVLEERGLNSDGQKVGKVRIITNNGAETFEVFFNTKKINAKYDAELAALEDNFDESTEFAKKEEGVLEEEVTEDIDYQDTTRGKLKPSREKSKAQDSVRSDIKPVYETLTSTEKKKVDEIISNISGARDKAKAKEDIVSYLESNRTSERSKTSDKSKQLRNSETKEGLGIIDSQKQIIKEVKDLKEFLTPEQFKKATALIKGVEDSKTLSEAKNKLANLLDYNNTNPSALDKLTQFGKRKTSQETSKEESVSNLREEVSSVYNKQQAQFAFLKDYKKVASKLKNPQEAKNLLDGVSNTKTLNEARAKLANSLEYGKTDPTAEDIIKKMSKDSESKKSASQKINELKKEVKDTVKNLNQLKKDFSKDVSESLQFLSDYQKKQAISLLNKVKDKTSLEDARTRLANLIEYGKQKPTTKDIVNSKGRQSRVDMSENELARLEKKIEQAAGKVVKKTEQEAVSYLKDRLKELGIKPNQIRTTELKRILTQFAKTDPTNNKQWDKFEDMVDGILNKASQREVKSLLSSRLKSAIKKLPLGKRKNLAKELKDVNYDKVKSKDLYESVVDSLYGSSRKESLNNTEIEVAIEKLKREQKDYLIEEFNNSTFSGIMTFDEYQEMINKPESKKTEETLESLLKKESERKQFYDSIVKRLNGVDSSNLTANEKVIYKSLKDQLNNKDIYNKLGDENLKKLFNAVEELFYLNSSAGLSKIESEIKGINKASAISKWNKSVGGFMSRSGRSAWSGMMNTTWDNFVNAISKKTQYGLDFTAKLLADRDTSNNLTQAEFNTLEQTLDAFSNKLNNNQIQKVGIVADLLQNKKGLTEEQIQTDYEGKLSNIRENIELESKTMERNPFWDADYQAAKRRKKALKSALDVVDKFNSKTELQKAVDNGNILSKTQKNLYEFVKKEAAKRLPGWQESIYTHTGKEPTPVDNYTPTYRKPYSTKADLNSAQADKSVSDKPSGRSEERVDNIQGTYANYDFIETSKAGLYDIINDTNSLPSKAELQAIINSKEFKDIFGKNDKTYKAIVDYLKGMETARSGGTPLDSIKNNKLSSFLNNAYGSLKAAVLRGPKQYPKQIAPILLGTAIQTNPKSFTQGMILASKMTTGSDLEQRALLQDIYDRSQTKNRTVKGDVNFDKASSSLAKRIIAGAYNPEGKGNKVSDIYDKLSEESISIADAYAANVSFFANLVDQLKKQGKTLEDVTNEDISKADAATNLINNTSDYTKTKKAYDSGGKNKIINNLLFLYKSFAQNQSVVFASSIPKAVRGDKLAAKMIGGQLGSLMMYSAISALLLELTGKTAETLLGYDEDELSLLSLVLGGDTKGLSEKIKKEKQKKFLEEINSDGAGVKALKETGASLLADWAPTGLDNLIKMGVNKVASSLEDKDQKEAIKKAYKDKYGFAPKDEEFLKIYEQNLLGIVTQKPYGRALSIIQDDNMPFKYKKAAYIYLLGEALGDNTLQTTKKFLYQIEKAGKELEKKERK